MSGRDESGYETGYYGIPGRCGKSVHVVFRGGPLCGTRIDKRAEFQWCADGIQPEYLECARCRAKGAPILTAQHVERMRFLGWRK